MTDNSSTPADRMRTAAEAWYLLDHPRDDAGATVAGYLAGLRVLRRTDPHAIPVQDAAVRAAMRTVDIPEIERWLDQVWGDVTGTLVQVIA